MRVIPSLALILATPAAAQQVAPSAEPSPYTRAIAAGYKAAMLCSGVFNAGRTEAQVEADELAGIYPDYAAIVPTLTATIARGAGVNGSVRVPFAQDMPPREALYQWPNGCRLTPIGARSNEPLVTAFRMVPKGFGERLAPDPRPWPIGDAGIAPETPPALRRVTAAAFDAATYGAAAKTTGVIVLRDGTIVAERYADGWGPLVSNRTWSVGKSIAGTLVGIGTRLTNHLMQAPVPVPEWGEVAVDPRASLTMDDLLRMASGLHGDTAGNRTDAVYFGGTAVTDSIAGLSLEAKPGTRFRYANNDILIAVRSLRVALGEDLYRKLPTMLFDPLGMTHTVAETDWRGNYVLSSQVWSTARDLARLGQFWLQDGVWQGERLLPEGWMRYMTTPSGPQPASGPGYGATLWLFGPKQGLPQGTYAAQGNRGQYVMVIPSRRLVIVRRGEDPGAARFDIARFAADVAAALP